MKPREFFPNMPDEVFNIWLQPAIEKYGWPFSYPITSIEGTDWEEIFGSNTSFTVFSNCQWALTELDIKSTCFHERTIDTLNSIYINATTAPTSVRSIIGTEQKFKDYALYSYKVGSIKAPIIAVQLPTGEYKVVDGHHRLSAFLSVVQEATSIPCWHPV